MGAESSHWQTGPGYSGRSGGEFIKYCCLNSAGVRSMNLVTPKRCRRSRRCSFQQRAQGSSSTQRTGTRTPPRGILLVELKGEVNEVGTAVSKGRSHEECQQECSFHVYCQHRRERLKRIYRWGF